MAAAAPAVKTGTPYQALINLSVPRLADPEHKTDLVYAGETVTLTEEQAKPFLERKPPVIRPAKEASSPLPVTLPKHLSGPMRGPATAQGERADPPGSSRIESSGPPELDDPRDEGSAETNALDIPPRR